MKSKCDISIHSSNYSSCCCMTQLILMFNQTENNNLFNPYGLLLLKTLNKTMKDTPSSLLSNGITIDQLCIFTELLTKYSSIYYYRMKLEYSKLIIKFGIDSINQSQYKNEPKLIERKNALANNMACIYEEEGNYDKASMFFEKLLNSNTNSNNNNNTINIDKAITYNNLGLIEMKRSRIAEGIHCFNLAYDEMKDNINQNIVQIKRNKKEVIAMIIFNYCFAYKKYLNKSYNEIYDKGFEYAKKYLGKDHPITVNYNDCKLEEIESICSSDTSSEGSQKGKDNHYSNLAHCESATANSNQNNREEIKQGTPNENATLTKENYKSQDKEMTSNQDDSMQIIQQTNQPESIIDTGNSSSTQITKKKETKTLPFKKKKLALKDCFKAAYQSIKPQSESQVLFSNIAKNLKAQREKEQQQASLLSKLEESKDIKSPMLSSNATLNKYNDIMTKFELTNPKDSLILNSNNNPILQSLKSKAFLSIKTNSLNMQSNRNIKQSTKSIFSTQNKKKGTTEIFKNLVSLNKGNIHHPLVEASTDFEVVDNLNNFYIIKWKNENNYEKDILKIIERSLENPSISEIRRILISKDNKTRALIIISNDDNIKTISITINDFESNNKVYNEKIEYDDIINCMNKISFYYSMPQHCNLSFISNVGSLINKILIKHCQFRASDNDNDINNKQELVLLQYQMSVSHQSFVMNFNNTNCCCSLLEDNHDITLVVYSQEDPTLCLRIDIYLDEGCFNTLFIEKEDKGIKMLFYQNTFNYEDFFSRFLVKMQEILKLNMNNKSTDVSYRELMMFYSKSIFKLDIQDRLKQKEFWIITKDSNDFQWRIELYTLEKIVISNGAFYINKQITLDSEDFINIIGSDPKDVYELMSDKDIIIAHKILLNTVKMRNIMLKILTEKNYDSMLRLIKLKPSCFFRFTFVIIHNKKYFCCAFEFIVYSKENYFLRLMLTEAITSRSYSKLYLPYYMNKRIYNIDELKKTLVEEFKLKKELLSNKKLRSVLVAEGWEILTKNLYVVFYENIEIILNKFKNSQS